MWNFFRRLRASPDAATEPEVVPCRDCLRCVKACPAQALSYSNKVWKLNLSACHRCGECAVVCPNELINVKLSETA